MEAIVEYIIQYKEYAPGIIFFLLILAGMNLPISIDIIMVTSAFLASSIIPEYTLVLFISLLLGTYLSAMVSYWIGRKLGHKILRISFFKKLFPSKRLKKMHTFYSKHGLLTLIIGRFIPFGVRNCIFMTTGISKTHFPSFIRRDAIACLMWTSICFFSLRHVGTHYQQLLNIIKRFNIIIFITCAVIATIIYLVTKKKKRCISTK